MPARNVTIKGTFTQNKHEYTINKHFYNEKGVEVKVVNGEPQTAVENTEDQESLHRKYAGDL